MVPKFDKVVFNGAVLEPHLVKTKFGWHVIKVLSLCVNLSSYTRCLG